ncbi:TPA: FliI/YscN family ATPase [Escherichia coli]|nr:FliI/YscN family ATPase [Escherichia coli]
MTTRLTRWLTTLDNFEAKMAQLPAVRRYGRLTRATGLVLEATGLQLPLGATCVIERQNGSKTHEVESEVVGFNGQRLFLMPLEEVEGVLPGARVYAKNISAEGLQSGKQLPLGPALLGRVLDGSGKPLDGLPSPDTTETGALITPPFNPLQRTPIEHVLDTGVRPINALLTVGRGQRMGLFAGSGVGKSVLLGMMARYTRADVIVVGLIGERGREVKDFIENILGAEGRARSVVIAAPADVSPLLRMQGAAYATRIAEDFRDRGQHVLLIMDSLTRYAMAQREIALAIGEPPATKGYPPSVFAKLPALVERAGNGISGGGVRFSHDKSSTQYHGSMLGNPFGDQGKSNDDQVLGQLSAGYMLTDDWRVYTRVAQGYKPSGYNIVPTAGLDAKPFVAEKSINYELGTRYETADVTLQAATFYTHTKDMQLYSGPVGMQTLSNAGKADATGVELEAKWRFAPGWSWDINGNVIRSEFTNDSELYHGNRVPFVPRYGAGSSVNGVIDTRYGALMPRLAVNLVGPHYFDGDNQLRQGTYATLDSSLGWQATERMNISVYVDNLFDRRYRTYGYMNGSSAVAQVNMGRTVGINTRIDFF